MVSPAMATRKEAIVTGGRYRSPIFAAMKFTAQTTTTRPIDAAITTRFGARPAEVSTYTESDQPLFAHGELLDAIQSRRKANPRARRHANRPLRRHCHFRLDDVLMPIAPAGGYVPGQNKVRQSGKRDVVCASDPGLQHPAAPHRNAVRLAKIMDLLRRRVPADASQLDVDDLAGTQRDRRPRVLQRVNAFVQANRRFEPLLQFHVTVQILPPQRLLDHHQVISIELLQQRPVRRAIRGIGIHHQLDTRKILPHPLHLLHVFARFDFDFDALVARAKFLLHGCGEFVQRILDSDGNARSNLLAHSAQQLRERHALLLGLGIPHGRFQPALGHIVPTDRLEQLPNLCRIGKFLSAHESPKVIAQNVPSRFRRFRAVSWRLAGHAFAPARHSIDVRLYQHDAPLVRAHEAGFERRDQLHPQLSQRDLSNSHLSRRPLLCKPLKIAPRRQQIRRACLPRAHSYRRVLTREPFRELLAHARLYGLHSLQITLRPLLDFRWHLNRRRGFRRAWHQVFDRGYHAGRVQPPFRHQSIRLNSPMQGTRCHAVKIGNVLSADCAQPVQIEMRVLHLQRIKRPLHQANPAAQGLIALEQFQHPPHAAVPIGRAHARLVRVQIHKALLLHTHHRQRVSHQLAAVECPQHLSAGNRRHHEHRHRLGFQVRFAPDFALQLHTRAKFLECATLSNYDSFAPLRFLRAGIHRFPATSPRPLSERPVSERLVASHSLSFSSRGTSAKVPPLSAARRSISRNRCENFALAFFSAISGSTSKKRARFTAAKSRSPISSSTFPASPSPEACRSSAHSSRSFSKIPCASSQSNPAREALRVNCKPSIVAGNVRGTPSSSDFGLSSVLTVAFPCRS